MIDLFQYDFFVNAFIASILASIACGIIGSYVVVKRIVFISGGISHSAYGGIGLGYFLGINPLFGALIFSLSAAGIISFLRTRHNTNEDTIIGMLWAFGMSLGVLFISFTPGYAGDLMSYLFGNILTVPLQEIYIILAIDVIIILIVALFFNQFLAITFDEEYARTLGLKVDLLYFILFMLIALTVIVLIKLVGIILLIALLTIPAAIAKHYAVSLKQLMFYSVAASIIFTISGLFISYYLNLPTGSSIILLSILGYILSYLYITFKNKRYA
ncbi:MAG: metal ABC transporter permease [Melioribacteraceae bacterium]|nr:metal ABC transporter permease [Melioribacteraceae bacterium]